MRYYFVSQNCAFEKSCYSIKYNYDIIKFSTYYPKYKIMRIDKKIKN